MAKNKEKARPAPADTPPESLDKVRDILFGGQMRLVEGRLQGLEERIQREQQAIRTEFTKNLADLEAAARKELDALGERLAAERAKRSEDLKALAAECKESFRGIEKRHARLEETTGQADADLRDQILQHSMAVADDIKHLGERLSSELNQAVAELQGDKLDTATLSELFAGMSEALAGEGRKTGKKAARG